MKSYTQLTQEERYHISVLCKEGFPRAEIVRRLKRFLILFIISRLALFPLVHLLSNYLVENDFATISCLCLQCDTIMS